jgi:hypothetical protein
LLWFWWKKHSVLFLLCIILFIYILFIFLWHNGCFVLLPGLFLILREATILLFKRNHIARPYYFFSCFILCRDVVWIAAILLMVDSWSSVRGFFINLILILLIKGDNINLTLILILLIGLSEDATSGNDQHMFFLSSVQISNCSSFFAHLNLHHLF